MATKTASVAKETLTAHFIISHEFGIKFTEPHERKLIAATVREYTAARESTTLDEDGFEYDVGDDTVRVLAFDKKNNYRFSITAASTEELNEYRKAVSEALIPEKDTGVYKSIKIFEITDPPSFVLDKWPDYANDIGTLFWLDESLTHQLTRKGSPGKPIPGVNVLKLRQVNGKELFIALNAKGQVFMERRTSSDMWQLIQFVRAYGVEILQRNKVKEKEAPAKTTRRKSLSTKTSKKPAPKP